MMMNGDNERNQLALAIRARDHEVRAALEAIERTTQREVEAVSARVVEAPRNALRTHAWKLALGAFLLGFWFGRRR